jgi:carbonic anhydrase
LREPDFLWVTNAGNVVTGPLSSTVRSLALACGVHDGKEIAVIGHTDCRFFQPVRFLLEGRLKSRGIEPGPTATKLDEFLSRLVNERSNVHAAVQHIRQSPLVPASVPVHGLMVDTESGQLEWIVNGYEAQPAAPLLQQPLPPPGSLGVPDFRISGDLPPIGTV